MSERFYQFDCPCCSKRIEFDPRTGKARAVKVQDAKASKDFDAFLADQQTESKRLDSVFGQAVDQQKKEKNTLDKLFETAKEDAKKNPDEKPIRPWDLE
jgi:hypothetical protein